MEEKKKLEEKSSMERLDMADDGSEKWVSNLSEAELEMEAGPNKASCKDKKRKAEQNSNRAKRKTMDVLNHWGPRHTEMVEG